MHRKFIALIISAAVAVTTLSLSAAPARADETTRVLAGIAALALLGAAIHSSRKTTLQVTTTPGWQPPQPRPRPPAQPRPHPKVSRFVLPQYCLLPTPRYRGNDTLVGENCLRRYYGATRTAQLPGQCRATFWNGRKWRSGYDPTCLRNKGYVIRR